MLLAGKFGRDSAASAVPRATRSGCVTRLEQRRHRRQAHRPPRCSHAVVPSTPSGKGAANRFAPRSSSARAVSARNGCASRNLVFGPTAGSAVDVARRQETAPGRCRARRTAGRTDPRRRRPARRRPASRSSLVPAGGSVGNERGETGILALRECRLDSAAGIIEHADRGRKRLRQPHRGARQIELDDFGRTGADQKQQLDVRPALEQLRHDPVEFVVGIGEPGEIPLVDDRGREARLGEDHHAGRGLDEMRAGARTDDEEERVLDLAVQPDDAGQPAEHLALAALAEDRSSCATSAPVAHPCTCAFMPAPETEGAADQREPLVAARGAQLQQELRGVDDVGGVGGEREQHLLARRRRARRTARPDRRCAAPARGC